MARTLLVALSAIFMSGIFAGAQELPDSLATPADTLSAAADSLALPEGFGSREGEFRQGLGAPVDTLDIGDGRLRIVLKDDHTWYYIKNFELIEADELFLKNWTVNSLNPYSDVSLSSLPLRNSICLVDSASVFVCPYQTKVFSRFGYRHGRRHQGVDLPLVKGTPVKAAFDGKVRASTFTKGYGNIVILRHENGLETYYGHLSKREVQPGDWVHAGDVIGLGGSTGRSTGPHLHFETRYQGYAFDPQWLIDFETGRLRSNVFVLRRSYLDPGSRYVPTSIDEEDDVYASDEKILEEEKRIAAEKAAMRYHTVRSGDTLSAIARKNGKSLSAIKALNPGINPNKLRIGQKVRVN